MIHDPACFGHRGGHAANRRRPHRQDALVGVRARLDQRLHGRAATWASERVSQRGLPPLPHTTAHTLRRTYISIALFANRFDVLSGVRVHRASAPLVGESRVAEPGSRLSATLRC